MTLLLPPPLPPLDVFLLLIPSLPQDTRNIKQLLHRLNGWPHSFGHSFVVSRWNKEAGKTCALLAVQRRGGINCVVASNQTSLTVCTRAVFTFRFGIYEPWNLSYFPFLVSFCSLLLLLLLLLVSLSGWKVKWRDTRVVTFWVCNWKFKDVYLLVFVCRTWTPRLRHASHPLL